MSADSSADAGPLPFASPAAVAEAFDAQDYLCAPELATVVFVALRLGRPLLLEGPAGVGKTELAKALSAASGRRLIRLQCYEGLDEGKALYEWSYAKQLLYVQLVRETVGELLAASPSAQSGGVLADALARLRGEADAFFAEDFLLERPLLAALRAAEPTVLLIDEIDRADEEFEAFLLELLSDFQVSIPELGTLRARCRPAVFLTSNGTRQLSDALRRRCLYAWLDYPSATQEVRIVQRKVPGLEAELRRKVVLFVQELRGETLRKLPSVSETLDWAATLVALGAESLEPAVLRHTLGALLKDREDIDRILRRFA